jgi:hypothetical protein
MLHQPHLQTIGWLFEEPVRSALRGLRLGKALFILFVLFICVVTAAHA